MVQTRLIFPWVSIAESIRKYRKAKGLTQTQLAEKLSTTQHVITNYERGLRRPPSDKIPTIAKALGVSLEELYGMEGRAATMEEPRKAPNRRAAQMQKIFEGLPPADQRALLKQAKGLIKSR